MSRFINKATSVVFAVLSVLILAARFEVLTELTTSTVKRLVIAAALIAILSAFWFFRGAVIGFIKRQTDKLSVSQMILIIISASLVTKFAFTLIFRLDTSVHPDISRYMEIAEELTGQGGVTSAGLAKYALNYPHTLAFSLFIAPIYALAGNGESLVYASVFAVFLTLGVALLFDTARRYIDKSYAFIASAFLIITPAEMLLPQFTIHEIVFLLLHSVAIWLIFKRLPEAKNFKVKLIYAVLGAFCVSLATIINKMGYVAVIALLLYFVLQLFRQKLTRPKIFRYSLCVLISALCFISILSGFSALTERIVKEPEDYVSVNTSIPANWNFFVGLNYKYGGEWNDEDRALYDKYDNVLPDDEVREYKEKLLTDRAGGLLKSPSKLFGLLRNKFKTVWGKSTHTVWYAKETADNKNLYDKFYFPFYLITNIIYLIAAFVSVASIRFKRYDDSTFITYCKAFIIGVTAVLMIAEVQNKYIIHVLPLYLIVCFADLKRFSRRFKTD